MSKFVVDFNEAEKVGSSTITENANAATTKKRGRFGKILRVLGVSLAALFVVGAVGGYFYWQYLKRTPQYSLALLIDAARRDDQKAIDGLVDTNQIIDDFLPQVTDKAVELYGRNLPPATVAKVREAAAPLLPAIKIRARAEVPALIREKTEKFAGIPFWAIALGASRYVNITHENDKAYIVGNLPEQQASALIVGRNGERWRLVGIKDENLARQVAEKIGQQIIAAASKGGVKKAGEELGVQNLADVLKQLDGVFK